MTTLNELHQRAVEYDRYKTDYNGETLFYFDKEMKVMFDLGGLQVGPYDPTDWAMQQLAAKAAPGTFGRGTGKMLPKDTLLAWKNDEYYAPRLARILNENVRRTREYGATWFVRTYDDTVRAFLSERYAPVANSVLLQRMQDALRLLNAPSVSVFRSFNTPDELNVRVVVKGLDVFPPGEPAPYGLGFYASNSEIGRGSIRIYPLIQRTGCHNSIIMTQDADATLEAIHRGALDVLYDRVALAIGNAIKLSAEQLQRFLLTRNITVPNIWDQIAKIAAEENWATEFTSAVYKGLEGGETLYHFINGLTYAAHEAYPDNAEEQARWEMRAGTIVANPALSRLHLPEQASVR